MKIKVKGEIMGQRLDKFLTEKFEKFSRSALQKMIKSGGVLVNGEVVKNGYVLMLNDSIAFDDAIKVEGKVSKVKLNIDVVYDAADFFVVNKPAGISVHPSETNLSEVTLVSGVLDKIKVSDFEEFRPGVVHRLDKDTSGLLVLAKNKAGYDHFVSLFKKHLIKKKYLALVKGILEVKEGVVDSPIFRDLKNRKKMGLASERVGKKAISAFKVLKEFELDLRHSLSLLEVEIMTGRTHQIRVHMAAIAHPVAGDSSYGDGNMNKRLKEAYGLKRQFLHAYSLEFKDLAGKKISLKCDLPKELESILDQIK